MPLAASMPAESCSHHDFRMADLSPVWFGAANPSVVVAAGHLGEAVVLMWYEGLQNTIESQWATSRNNLTGKIRYNSSRTFTTSMGAA